MKLILKLALLFACGTSFAQTNLMDSSIWTVGTGSLNGFSVYHNDSSENERVSGVDPHGNTSVLWKGIPSGNGNQDGGWRGDNMNIDHTKTFRFTVWLKKTSSHDGEEIFGIKAFDSGSQTVSINLDGSTTNSPWFSYTDVPQLDTWYLVVGYLHTSNYGSSTHLGALYGTDGTMVRSLTDYKFATTAVTMRVRSILYGDANGTSEIYYWNPTLYEVNGQEPTITELINGPNGSDTQAPTAPTLSSTGQTDTTIGLSWTGATDDTAVTGYKVFKDGVLEATLGNVSTYQVTGLSASTAYSLTVTALDAAGNESVVSNAVNVTTNAASGGGSGNWTSSGSDINYTSGNVGIGTTSIPSDYKLAVEGKIISEEVKVQLQSQWPDYVFNNDYNLPTLQEVKKHIDEKGHLMNIPSAKEVKANGIELGEMNKMLLEKIEELMLYTLAQEEMILTQRKELKNKNKAILEIKNRLDIIEKYLNQKRN